MYIYSAYLIYKLPLERISFRIEIPELDESEFAKLWDAAVGGLGLQEELAEHHLLAAEEGTALRRLEHGTLPLHGVVRLSLATTFKVLELFMFSLQ